MPLLSECVLTKLCWHYLPARTKSLIPRFFQEISIGKQSIYVISDKVPKMSNSILRNAVMKKDLSEILEKYKSSDYSKEEINLRVEVDKVIYVLNRCVSKLNVLVSSYQFSVYGFLFWIRVSIFSHRKFNEKVSACSKLMFSFEMPES